MTDRYAVFGNPIAHSMSPRIHALFAQQTGQDMSYEAILAPLDGFEKTVHDFIAAGARGANVTVPFKEEAFRLATELTARAQAAGAANTLIFANHGISGDNTDGAGLVRDIEINLGFPVAGKRVLLLGAGGAARGVLQPLSERNPRNVVIANRNVQKALALASQGFAALRPDILFEFSSGGFEHLAGQTFDLVINATSTGLNNVALPLPDCVFAPGCLAYEMVYGRETPFMRQARTAGAQVSDGLGMLVEQAAEAFFIWHGIRPDTAPLMATLRSA